jgi:hypothetical protein
MAMRINKGENFIVRRPIKDKTGATIPVANCSGISVEIKQRGKVLATLTHPSANCRTYSGNNYTLEIEVIKATSDLFEKGDVYFKTTITAPDTDFVTEGTQKRVEEKLVAVVD